MDIGAPPQHRASHGDAGRAERRALVERFHEKYPRLATLWGGRAMPANRVMCKIAPERVKIRGLA